MTSQEYSYLLQSLSIETWSLFPEATLSYGINDIAFVKWGYKTIFFFCFSYWCNGKAKKIIVNFVENT